MTPAAEGNLFIERCSCRAREGKLEIEVVLRNPSERPWFVIPRVRQIQLGEDGTLQVWFSCSGPRRDDPRVRKEVHAPATEPIPADGEKTLSVKLPLDMTRLVVNADGSVAFEAVPVSRTTSVDVHVAVGDKPFYHNPSRQMTVIEQVRQWGQDLRAHARREGSETAS